MEVLQMPTFSILLF